MSFIELDLDEMVVAVLLCLLLKVYSTSIYMVLSEEGCRAGVQPSLQPYVADL
ncbi:MAG TPA: hypothetical protein VII93_04055 [Anaerolineales bacterium]